MENVGKAGGLKISDPAFNIPKRFSEQRTSLPLQLAMRGRPASLSVCVSVTRPFTLFRSSFHTSDFFSEKERDIPLVTRRLSPALTGETIGTNCRILVFHEHQFSDFFVFTS